MRGGLPSTTRTDPFFPYSPRFRSNFLDAPASPLGAVPGVGPATIAGASGASGPDILAAFNLLDGLNDLGSINDRYYQHDRNWALFTHNIFHVTDTIDFTFGLRYTKDKRSEEHTSELQSLMRISYAVFCLKKKK